jgi:hypothetical protein
MSFQENNDIHQSRYELLNFKVSPVVCARSSMSPVSASKHHRTGGLSCTADGSICTSKNVRKQGSEGNNF